MGILNSNSVFRMGIKQIQHQQEQPFRRFHNQIYSICDIFGADMLGDGVAAAVVKAAKCPMTAGQTLGQKLLERIGNA